VNFNGLANGKIINWNDNVICVPVSDGDTDSVHAIYVAAVEKWVADADVICYCNMVVWIVCKVDLFYLLLFRRNVHVW